MQTQQGVRLNSTQYKNVWSMFRTHPTVAACVKILRSTMLSMGVSFDAEMPDRISQHYETVAHQAFDWLLTVGLVPIMIKRDKLTRVHVPIIPEAEAVSITVETGPMGERVFSGYLLNRNSTTLLNEQAAPKLLIWVSPCNAPSVLGNLMTPIVQLEGIERFAQTMRDNELVSSYKRANPTIVSRSVRPRNSDTDGVVWNVDEKTMQDIEEEDLRNEARKQKLAYDIHREDWGGTGLPDSSNEMQQFAERCEPHEYFLSTDRDLVRQLESHGTPNFPQLMRQLDERIFQCFGVPYSMLSNAGTQLQSNSMQVYSLNSTIRTLKHQIEQFLTHACNLARRMGVYEHDQDPSEVRVTVNTIPCVDLATVDNAFERGYIDHTEATKLYRSSLGLDPSSESAKPKPQAAEPKEEENRQEENRKEDNRNEDNKEDGKKENELAA